MKTYLQLYFYFFEKVFIELKNVRSVFFKKREKVKRQKIL